MTPDVTCTVISASSSVLVGLFAYFGVASTNRKANGELQHKMDKHLAVTDNKIDNLTKEVQKHNNFAERIPKVEQKLDDVSDRVEHLEQGR